MLIVGFTFDLLRMRKVTDELINPNSKYLPYNNYLDNDLLKIKELTGGLTRNDSNHMFCTAFILPGQSLLVYDEDTGKMIITTTIQIATAKHCIYDETGRLMSEHIFFSLAHDQEHKFKVVKYKDLSMREFANLKPKINITDKYNDYIELLIQIKTIEDTSILSLLHLIMIDLLKYEIIPLNNYISSKIDKKDSIKSTFAYFNYGLVKYDSENQFILAIEALTNDESERYLNWVEKKRNFSDNEYNHLKNKIIPVLKERSGAAAVKCRVTRYSINCKINSILHGFYIKKDDNYENFSAVFSKNKSKYFFICNFLDGLSNKLINKKEY